MTWMCWSLGTHLRHVRERTRSVLGGIPTQSVGTISVISSTPIMLMLVLSVIPESCRLPRGMHSVSHFRFCPCFARLADLFITMSAEHEHDQCPGSLMYNKER